jgi:hypothetical protein
MIAVFGYVREVLMCTNITLIPRRHGYLPYSSESMDEIEFEQIIKDMRDEK